MDILRENAVLDWWMIGESWQLMFMDEYYKDELQQIGKMRYNNISIKKLEIVLKKIECKLNYFENVNSG